MDWSGGYTARFMAYEVDPISWRDTEPVEIISGSISRNMDSIQQSASLDVSEFDGSTEKWIRIYMDARQTGDAYHGAMFTGLASTPKKTYEGNNVTIPVQCYSVLKPLDDIYLLKGWFIAAGADGIEVVKDLLSATPAPVTVDGAPPRMNDSIVAEDNETNLTMIYKILGALNWQIDISGDGAITLSPYTDTIDETNIVRFDSIMNDCLETKVDIEYDWFSAPNVYRVTIGDTYAIARDDSEESSLSTVSRGREIWLEETDVALSETETLDMYAERRLAAEQKTAYRVSYSRRYHPDVRVNSIIRLGYPKQEIDGYFRVESQSITLGYNATVSEEAYRI